MYNMFIISNEEAYEIAMSFTYKIKAMKLEKDGTYKITYETPEDLVDSSEEIADKYNEFFSWLEDRVERRVLRRVMKTL